MYPSFVWTRNRASTFDPNPDDNYNSDYRDDGNHPGKNFQDFTRHLADS